MVHPKPQRLKPNPFQARTARLKSCPSTTPFPSTTILSTSLVPRTLVTAPRKSRKVEWFSTPYFATSRRRGLMGRHGLAVLVLIASFGLMTPALIADNGKDHGKGNSHAKKNVDRDDKGWSRGKKTGWGNCGVPPGQAKKDGCRTYVYQGRPHYYYQDDRGRIIVRRPIIDLHGGVIVH